MKAFKKFLSYSYEPFRLHFCGPQDQESEKTVNDYLAGRKMSYKNIEKIARQFIGVYPYLRLIAQKNGLEYLDKQVIEAYWLGNNLLKQITVDDLKKLILGNFIGPGRLTQEAGEKLMANIPLRAVAHHSFHVLYIGSVTGTVHLVNKMLDLCRIGWGKIVDLGSAKANDKTVIIQYRPLIIHDKEIRLSHDQKEKAIKWNQNILPKLTEGQTVSFHWNLACEILSEDQIKNLEKYTLRNIEAINSLNQ